jgi:hypothetical protein
LVPVSELVIARFASSTRVLSPGAASAPETAVTASTREEKLTMVKAFLVVLLGKTELKIDVVDFQWKGIKFHL